MLKTETLSCLQLYSNQKSFLLWLTVSVNQKGFNINIIHINLFFHYRSKITTFIDDNKALLRRMYGDRVQVELVSKELNPFGEIALFLYDWAPGTLTGGK